VIKLKRLYNNKNFLKKMMNGVMFLPKIVFLTSSVTYYFNYYAPKNYVPYD